MSTDSTPGGDDRLEQLRTLASFCEVKDPGWVERVDAELRPGETAKSMLPCETGFGTEGMLLVITDQRILWLAPQDADSGSVDLAMVKKKAKIPRFSFVSTTLTIELTSGHKKSFKLQSWREDQAKVFTKTIKELAGG